jgi:VWFA-related protein
MKKNVVQFLVILLVLPSFATASGQTPQRPGEDKIVVGTAEVRLDVIARDKNGRVIRDLKVEDFEVTEDGVRQQVESFRLVTRNTAAAPESTEAGITPAAPRPVAIEKRADPEIGVSVIALVFDRLSTDARKRAHDAAMGYINENSSLGGFMGVFAINLSLLPLQNYTTNIEQVKKAVERAGSLASSTFDSARTPGGFAETSSQRDNAISSATAAAGAAGASGNGAGAGAAGSAAGGADVDQQFAQMQRRTEETFEVLQRDQQGYATTNGLLAIVNSMSRLPGRKAVIFFSEGLSLPPNVQQHFRSVINSANRANVSVYAVDSAGLRVDSTLQATREEMMQRARRRMDTLDTAGRQTGAPLMAGLERNEDLLTLNPQSGLTQLALQTGGQFIGDTNKIGTKLRQVDEDLNTYYLLTYAPANSTYDGKFRNIAVKIRRSGIEAQTRKGYFAVPPTGSTPLFYYEAQPLAALNRPTKPKDFPLLVGSLNFPQADRPGRTAIEVEAPASAFTFNEDTEKKIYNTDFSFVILVKDQAKQVVEKLSYHYALIGKLDETDKAKKGKILFYRDVNLPPGRYDVEAVAYDAFSSRASVNRSTVEVPDADESKLRLSSISIVHRIESLKEKTDSPFVVGDQVLIYPNLGEAVRKAANSQKMGFYFNIYLAKEDKTVPRLTLEVLQSGKFIARVQISNLTPPDKEGRIQYASALPLDSLQPGSYELKISVSDAKGTVSRSAPFVLEP